MELSKMFGVERDTDFGVEGYESFRFNINTTVNGRDRLYFKHNDGCWIFAKAEMLTDIIYGAPGNIIHLPPPLTDVEREQLCALYKLRYHYLTKDITGAIVAHAEKPRQIMNDWVQGGFHAYIPYGNSIYGLPIKNETEPYDIGKALGVGG